MIDQESKYKFAIELIIEDTYTIEKRALAILNFCEEKHGSLICVLSDLEATGPEGVPLTKEVEISRFAKKEYRILLETILEILEEDGQVLDLNMIMYRDKFSAKIIISRGKTVDFLANDTSLLDEKRIGKFNYLDLDLFVR